MIAQPVSPDVGGFAGSFQARASEMRAPGSSLLRKRIASRIDDTKQGVSQADVYQMMADGHLNHAPRLTLRKRPA